MDKKVTRKALREEASRLGAIKVCGDIYNYENIVSYIRNTNYSGNLEKVPNSYKEIVSEVLEACRKAYPEAKCFTNTNCLYSRGTCGNNGRLDYINPVFEDGTIGYCPATYIYY